MLFHLTTSKVLAIRKLQVWGDTVKIYIFSRLMFLSLGSNKMVLFTTRYKNLRGMNLLAPKWFFSFDEKRLFWELNDFASALVDMVCFQASGQSLGRVKHYCGRGRSSWVPVMQTGHTVVWGIGWDVLRVVRELASVLIIQCSVTFDKLWQS